jgi:hypothetical protein
LKEEQMENLGEEHAAELERLEEEETIGYNGID